MKPDRTWIALILICLGGVIALGASTVFERMKKAEEAEMREALEEALKGVPEEKFSEVEQALLGLSERFPKSPTIWLNVGISRMAQGQNEKAREAFQKALSLDSRDYDAMAELATLAIMRGDNDEAFSILNRIPAKKGRMVERLSSKDPVWMALKNDPRMKELKAKHRVAQPESSISRSSRGSGGTKAIRLAPDKPTGGAPDAANSP